VQKSIALADSYFDSYDRLDKQSRRITRNSLKMFASDEKGNSFQVHDLKRTQCDKSFKSARINDDIRLIFSQKGSQFIMLYVDRHDAAYNWAEGKFLNTNRFGALYLHDDKVEIQQQNTEANDPFSFGNKALSKSLLAEKEITKKDLVKLGIAEVHAGYLMEINDDDKFMEFITVYPQELQEALIDLVAGSKNMTQVYADLQDDEVADTNNDEFTLTHKNTKRRFFLVEDLKELDLILDEELERWKIFLHPKQEFLVKRKYRGPVIVEGGPGTGKTVVGVHRAVFLAKNIYKHEDGCRILFCTFSKKLASYINEKVAQLMKQKHVSNNVYITGIDKLISDLINRYRLTHEHLDINGIRNLFIQTYNDLETEETLLFYQAEYKEVIQKYNISSLTEYLRINRTGQGKPLNSTQREKVWVFFNEFLKRKKKQRLIDFEDRAHIVYDALVNKNIEPMFDSLIIDEAQDLSPIKLKLLSLLVRQKENNLMILSDQNQRIYNLTSWKKDVEINIVGRTFHLGLNYRTTKQIREYADKQFVHSKIVTDHIKDYKSLLVGADPVIRTFENTKLQYNFIVNKVKELISLGIKPNEIGIISPTNQAHIAGVLEYEGIKSLLLKDDLYPRENSGVCVSTLQGAKGLEFRSVILANYSEIGKEINRNGEEDWYTLNQIKQIECLKYVATTRAREELIITFVEQGGLS
jgi:mRNA-degrading endonuclease RelE of RelBE toxin-antitoxin system